MSSSKATTADSTTTPSVMATTEVGTLSICRMFDEVSRKAHSNEANTIPRGLLRPSSAMAIPVNPMPDGVLSE